MKQVGRSVLASAALLLMAATVHAQLKLGKSPECHALDGASLALFWSDDQEKFSKAVHYLGSFMASKREPIPEMTEDLLMSGLQHLGRWDTDDPSSNVPKDRACAAIVSIANELGCQMNDCYAEIRID